MEIIIKDSAELAAGVVADTLLQVASDVRANGGKPVWGLATGSSPVATYQNLIQRFQAKEASFADVSVFMLDEYVGLGADHPQSYAHFIREHFISQVDIDPANVQSPRGDAADPRAEAIRYDAAITASGVDIQLLGIGTDGHIAFNEPASSLSSRTRIKTLTQQTLADNARFFAADEQVPQHVLTQGLGTIMDARNVVLIATGTGKADAVASMVEGPLSASCPGSILQMHQHVTIVLDEAAASKLAHTAYYKHVQEHKHAGALA